MTLGMMMDHQCRVRKHSEAVTPSQERLDRYTSEAASATEPLAINNIPAGRLNRGPGTRTTGATFVGMPAGANVAMNDVLEVFSGPNAPINLKVIAPPDRPRGHHLEAVVEVFTGKLPSALLFAYTPGYNVPVMAGVHTRGVPASFIDANGVIQLTSGLRDAHYIGAVRTLLLEQARTNLAIRSEPTVALLSSQAQVADAVGFWAQYGLSNGIAVGDNSIQRHAYVNVPTLAPLTQYAVSIFIVMDDGGVPVLSASPGADVWFVVNATSSGQTGFTVEQIKGPLYRLSALVTTGASIVNAAFGIIKRTDSTPRTFKVCGYQIEQASSISSYIPTAGAAVTRTVDELYFPWPHTPQEMTAYFKFIELGSFILWGIGRNATGARIRAYISGGLRTGHHNGTTDVSSTLGAPPARGSVVELRSVLRADGSVETSQSINGGAETAAAQSVANAMAAAWFDGRLFFGSGSAGTPSLDAFQRALFLSGVRSMDFMRAYNDQV